MMNQTHPKLKMKKMFNLKVKLILKLKTFKKLMKMPNKVEKKKRMKKRKNKMHKKSMMSMREMKNILKHHKMNEIIWNFKVLK